uniref:RNA 2',3'-cyclic phosphodiesterase n=1 Tax=Ammonifex degensii TaxID=42838 RepID=A0A7C1F392_9THEO
MTGQRAKKKGLPVGSPFRYSITGAKTMATMRLFWAVTLPKDVRDRLAIVQSSFRKLPLDVKWVEVENFHLTLRFLGDTDRAMVDSLLAVAKERLGELLPFTLILRGVGVFPSLRQPRVLWVGVERALPLFNLHHLLEEALRQLGFPPEAKRFSPHITLGRFRTGANTGLLEEAIKELGTAEVAQVNVIGIALIASELTPKGPVYTPVGRVNFNLAAGQNRSPTSV